MIFLSFLTNKDQPSDDLQVEEGSNELGGNLRDDGEGPSDIKRMKKLKEK